MAPASVLQTLLMVIIAFICLSVISDVSKYPAIIAHRMCYMVSLLSNLEMEFVTYLVFWLTNCQFRLTVVCISIFALIETRISANPASGLVKVATHVSFAIIPI